MGESLDLPLEGPVHHVFQSSSTLTLNLRWLWKRGNLVPVVSGRWRKFCDFCFFPDEPISHKSGLGQVKRLRKRWECSVAVLPRLLFRSGMGWAGRAH